MEVVRDSPVFKVFAQKGFQTKFSNGFTVSVMFGAGNYCEHRFNRNVEPAAAAVSIWERHESPDAEIAVIGPNGEFRNDFPGCHGGDSVQGWVTPKQMLEVMNWAESQPS